MKKLLSEVITAWWSEVDTKLVNPKSEEAIKGLKLVLREDFGFDSDVIDYVVEMVRSTPTNFDLGGKTSGIDVGKNQTAVSAQLHPVWDDDDEEDDEDDVYNNNDGELSEWDITLQDGLEELNEDIWVRSKDGGNAYAVKNFNPETQDKLSDDEVEQLKKSGKIKDKPSEEQPDEKETQTEPQQKSKDDARAKAYADIKQNAQTALEKGKQKDDGDSQKQADKLDDDTDSVEIKNSLKEFEKFISDFQKQVIKLSEKKRIKELEKLDTLSESFDKLPDDVKNVSSVVFAKGQIFEGRENSGIGKNRLGYLDVKTLASNKDYLMRAYGDGSAETVKEFVKESRKIKINEDYVQSSFDLLPESLQKSLMGKGKVGDAGKNKHFLGYVRNDGTITSDKSDPNIKKDEQGNLEVKRGNPGNKDRGRFVWRCILEQGGQDPYTGLPLDLSAIDLEHTVAFDNKDNGEPTEQDYLNREHDDNIIICATNINQQKSNLSMKDFYENMVDGQIGKSEEEFKKESETYETINEVASQTQQKAALILEEGKIKKGYDFKTLKETFDVDDETYTNARNEFRKVAETAEDKKALTKLKSEIGKNTLMAMGLGRGLTDPSGRRTIKLSSDNLYRGFLLSMADEPDRQDEFKDAWEDARKIGNSDEYRLKGKGQQGMVKYLIDNKFISDKILSDKKMGKVFQNALNEIFDEVSNRYVLIG